MELNDQQDIVGIDLGTTNSAVAYVDLTIDADRRRTEIFRRWRCGSSCAAPPL